MNKRKFYLLDYLHTLWQNFVRLECFCSLKISSKHNLKEALFYDSPLVGYSFLSSAYKTSSTRSRLTTKNRKGSCNSVEIAPCPVEFIHERPFGRPQYEGYFPSWIRQAESGFPVFQLPIEKLLFDILKNLVTFTASNHCMYGGKRYN